MEIRTEGDAFFVAFLPVFVARPIGRLDGVGRTVLAWIRGGTQLAKHPSSAPRLRLLGAFQVTRGISPVPLATNVQRVVAFLALAGCTLRRSHVAGTLWPDTTDDRAAANLRSVLWRLASTGSQLVRATPTEMELSREVRVDLRETEDGVRRFLRSPEEHERIGLTVSLLVSDLLPGWYEEWVVMDRERFRELRLHALEGLCEQYTADGRLAEAVEAGMAAVAGEPLRESAHRALIQAYLAEGNPGKALRQYERYRLLLLDELGVEPTARIKRLVAEPPAPVTVR